MAEKAFLIGNEIVVKAALACGADSFFGYPMKVGGKVIGVLALFFKKSVNKKNMEKTLAT